MKNVSLLYGLSEVLKSCKEEEHKNLMLSVKQRDEKAYKYYSDRYMALNECLGKIMQSEEDYPFEM